MNDREYPEALRLASLCEDGVADFAEIAAELRRLYHEVQRLEDKLDDIDYQNSMNA